MIINNHLGYLCKKKKGPFIFYIEPSGLVQEHGILDTLMKTFNKEDHSFTVRLLSITFKPKNVNLILGFLC